MQETKISWVHNTKQYKTKIKDKKDTYINMQKRSKT